MSNPNPQNQFKPGFDPKRWKGKPQPKNLMLKAGQVTEAHADNSLCILQTGKDVHGIEVTANEKRRHGEFWTQYALGKPQSRVTISSDSDNLGAMTNEEIQGAAQKILSMASELDSRREELTIIEGETVE